MASHSSATAHAGTLHVTQTSRTNTILNALKRRAQSVLNDKSIDPQSRAIIRYALETTIRGLPNSYAAQTPAKTLSTTCEASENNEPDRSEANVSTHNLRLTL